MLPQLERRWRRGRGRVLQKEGQSKEVTRKERRLEGEGEETRIEEDDGRKNNCGKKRK